ncbi:35431_t:CDS:2, partial [Racocetra persica]
CLNQKSAEYNEAKRLFTGLTDLDYKPGHREHIFYKYWLASRLEEVTLKGYTVIDHPFEVYRISDTHEYIDSNQPLHLIIDIDARQKPDPTNPK